MEVEVEAEVDKLQWLALPQLQVVTAWRREAWFESEFCFLLFSLL